MKNFLLVGVLLVLWFASMLFYLPLAVTIVLFAALVSTTSIVIWLTLMSGGEDGRAALSSRTPRSESK
jgi:hypothetical protein